MIIFLRRTKVMKKTYFTPEMKINAFDCEAVLTNSAPGPGETVTAVDLAEDFLEDYGAQSSSPQLRSTVKLTF